MAKVRCSILSAHCSAEPEISSLCCPTSVRCLPRRKGQTAGDGHQGAWHSVCYLWRNDSYPISPPDLARDQTAMTKLLCILASLTLPARDLPQDAGNLWQTDNVFVVGVGASLATAAYATNDAPRSELSSVDGPARITDTYGAGTFNIPIAIGLWGFGHATHNEPVRDFGHGLTRALGLTQLVVGPIKVLSHRLRPNEANHRSFPSGHTANTFAMARFIQRETSTTISLPFYALAAITGAGRVEGRQHYLSDVLMGATLGIIVGGTVGREQSSGRVSWQPMTQAPGLRLRVRLN